MNAVFERDYIRTSVSGRYLLLRTGFALAIALLVGVLVLSAFSARSFEGVGSRVLAATTYAGVALLFVAVPGSFGTSLVHARATNALPILLASPITPLEVAWGAFLSRAAGYSVFILACWPPVAIALSFGGIEPYQLALATAALLGTLLVLAAPCFVISAWARSTGAAVVASYLAAATLLAGLGALGDGLKTAMPSIATAVSPTQAILVAIEPDVTKRTGEAGIWLFLAGSVAVALFAVLLATWRLHREASGELQASLDATARRGYRPLRHENPILDRELRTGGSLRTRSTGRTLLGLLALSEIAYLVAAWQTGRLDSIPLFGGFLVFQTATLVLAASAAGATSLAAEKEGGGLEMIRVTRLPARAIVEGKLLGLFRAILPALAVPMLHLVWGAAQGILSWFAVPAFLVSGAVVSSTWVIIGMQQSLDQRDPHKAVLRTMGVLGILGGLVATYLGATIYATTMSSLDDRWLRLTLAGGANPVGAILGWVAALRVGGSDLQTTNLAAPGPGEVVAGLVVGSAWLFLHVLVALAVFKRLAHHYRTRFEG